MKMLDASHSGLYYPQDPHLLDEQTRTLTSAAAKDLCLPTALLLPHAAWEHCLDIVHAGLAATASLCPSQIVLLAPHHGGQRNEPLWVPSSDGLALPSKTYGFAVSLRKALLKDGVVVADDAPFIDEPSWELLIPLIAAYHPSSPILPILSAERTGEHAAAYADLVSKATEVANDTLVIVTANANRPLSSPKAEEHARLFVSSLQDRQDHGRRSTSTCNCAALRAVGRQRWYERRQWRILKAAVRGVAYDEILLDEHEKHVWQVTAILES